MALHRDQNRRGVVFSALHHIESGCQAQNGWFINMVHLILGVVVWVQK